MLYNKINSRKHRTGKYFLIWLMITAYSLTLSGCTSTRYYFHYSPYPAIIDSTAVISKIVLKNNKTVDCEDKIVQVEKGDDSTNYIVVKSFKAGADYKPVWSEKRIPENDILRINMEKSEVSDGKTALYIAGTAVISVLTIFLILSLSNTK